MSRDKAKVRFKTALDPGLLLSHQQAESSKGKGKARAGDVGLDGKGRTRKPFSRVNSLILSTDSPKYVRPQLQPSACSSKDDTSILASTIGSFGSRSSIALSKDVSSATRYPGHSLLEESRTSAKVHRLSSPVKRRRLDAETPDSEHADSSLSMQQPMIEDPGIDNTADVEWDNIWGRWNSQNNAAGSGSVPRIPVKPNNNLLADVQEVVEEVQKKLLSSQHSQLSMQSEDGRFETTWSIHEQGLPETELGLLKDSLQGNEKLYTIDSMDDSRSRMDEGLLLGSDSIDVEEEDDEQVQHRIDLMCNSESASMQRVQHVIFTGSVVHAHFGPAWDGYQLKKPPPSRLEMMKWAAGQTSQGQLYDYEDMDSVPQWHDEAHLIL